MAFKSSRGWNWWLKNQQCNSPKSEYGKNLSATLPIQQFFTKVCVGGNPRIQVIIHALLNVHIKFALSLLPYSANHSDDKYNLFFCKS